jgi:hypothetical protein
MNVIPEAGALLSWWAALRAGSRTKYESDALWKAACLEARARDLICEGCVVAANEDRRAAAQIILDSVRSS